MARIAGVDIPNQKHIWIALTYIRGIGPALSRRILDQARIKPDILAKELTEEDVVHIREAIDTERCPVEGELRRIVSRNIRRLKEIGSYRGSRHQKGLPARGQRTRTNARTKRGRRRTVGGMKRILQKT
ncbi:30S ribosomal protein S13 [Candidatus Parcubacteria bacterium]|nr:30S ribosomal protein S13 [Candidatus Parcubacteria bacterium]